MKILHVDTNHPLLLAQFAEMGFSNEEDYRASKSEIAAKIHNYEGLIIRSRFSIDEAFLNKAVRLRFIGRVGAGLENIDVGCAEKKGIYLAAAPEGNRNAVGEHALGMLLSLMNKLNKADREIRRGIWDREGNRGHELSGKTVGIIGYGNTGKAFSRKLAGFRTEVLCVDIIPGIGDDYARQVTLAELQGQAEVLSLHVPQTPQTLGMVNPDFINGFKKPFWLLNTARGRCVQTAALAQALASGRVLGAGLDVLEYEKDSFENLSDEKELPEALRYLIQSDRVILSPHVAGWTVESREKLAQTIVDKIRAKFCHREG